MECEVMSKTYEQIQIDPQAARVVGEMELSGKTYGFHFTALTAAMLDPLLGGSLTRDVTLITEAECVKVTKATTAAWVAGDPIFWIEASDHFTNVDDGGGYLVGKAAKDATQGAEVGYMVMHDYYPVQRGLQIGTSGTPYNMVTALPDPIISLYTTSNIVGNVEPFLVDTILTGIGATGGRGIFKLSTEVALGSFANALKGITDFGTNGRVTGLGSGICAELILPSTPPPGGNYAPMEVELRVPNSAGLGAKTSFMHLEAQAVDGGTGLTAFQTSGFLMSINGVTTQTDGLFEEINVGGVTQFDAVFRISVDGVPYFIGLCDDKTFV